MTAAAELRIAVLLALALGWMLRCEIAAMYHYEAVVAFLAIVLVKEFSCVPNSLTNRCAENLRPVPYSGGFPVVGHVYGVRARAP